ncbi:uncharacterized protein PHA67_004880 isoform 4-T5 [Liasis olivaceus]
MAAELRETSAPGPLKAEQRKGAEMGERILAGTKKGKGGGPGSRLIPTGSIQDFWERSVPEKATPEPRRSLQQRWESQLQEFLKVLEDPSLEGGSPQPRPPLPRSSPRPSLTSFRGRANCTQQPRAERGAQLAISLGGEAHPMEPPKRLHSQKAASLPLGQQAISLFEKDHLTEKAPLESWQRPLLRETKRESDRHAVLLDEKLCGAENEDRESRWTWSGRSEPSVACSPNLGEASETLYWNSLEKAEGKFINSQGTYEDLDESVLQPGLFPSERDNACLICRKAFRRRSNLIAHERTHSGERWYNCSECGKSFVSRAAFLIHQRVHTGEKPYKCSYCGKGFNTGSSLTRHKRIHTGEKPYKCLDCGKRFNDYSNFIVHKRIHTGEKPYECSVCGKRFSDNSNFIKHHH